ncbi:MAG: CHASE2 domain-containing protein [Deltaproteobacteria bacterium]|nr:CHASE2 domain-containing protein [Deltaproteobacteria bacterium]
MKSGLSIKGLLRKVFQVNAATITIAFTVLGMATYWEGVKFLELVELKTLDHRFESRGHLTPGPEVVLAVVDEKSLEEQGKWMWPRSKFAEMVRILSESGARVIAFDIGFLESDRNNTVETVANFEEIIDGLGVEDDRLAAYMTQAKQEADNDLILAQAIRESKARVVLGYFFQLKPGGLAHLDDETIEAQIRNVKNSRYTAFTSYVDPGPEVKVQATFMPQSNISVISSAARYSGYFNMFQDPDGTVRSIPLIMRCRDTYYAPLAVQALRAYTRKMPAPDISEDNEIGVLKIDFGKQLSVPTNKTGGFMVNYRGPAKTFPYISITDILHHRVSPETFRDKIVVVGATAIGIYDMRVTPFDPTFPGPEIHANIIDNILHRDFLLRPDWAPMFDLTAIVLIGLTLGLLLPRVRPLPGTAVAVGLFVSYILLCQYLFSHLRYCLNIVYPLVTLILVYVSLTAYKYLTEERKKKFIKGAFSTYLAPAVVEQLIKDPDKLVLGGEDRIITAFFSDVQDFTAISEALTAEEVVELLNEFLTEMTDIILGYEGTIDKFEGDAIIAFFGAPTILEDHAAKACKACIDMQTRLAELRTKWRAEKRPALKMRIGLNTGSAVVGNMGSRSKMDYTMMGDTVNTAARLEGVNKAYGTYTMISDATYVPTKNGIFVRELDRVSVVGKKEPVGVYELLGYPEKIDDVLRSVVELYAKGVSAYRNYEWDEAIGHFSEALSANPHDGPSQTMLSRCKDFKVSPPGKDWNGSFTMATK